MFELTKAQKEIQKAARGFAKGEFDKELACEFEKNNEFPEEIWKKATELGFVGIHFPEKYSGGEMGLLENTLILEEFCRKDSSIGGALALAGFASECVLRFGNEDLKEKFLPQVAEGEILSSGAFSETQRGGDYGDVKTTAVRQGEKWVITGTKTNVINGGKAGFYIVLCQTNSAAASAEQGKSMILVEANSTGLSFQNSGKKLGGNMTATATLSLDGVRVPAGNLVGKEGEGFSQLMMFLNESRVIAAAQALGTAMGSFDRALDYAKEREQFNKKLAQFQISQHKIADMATKIELAKLVTYKAAWSLDKGQADAKLSSMAKITACRTAMEVGAQTIQLFGGYGYMTEYEVERYYRDAKVIELLAGTRDVQKDIIAQSIIGKIK